VNDLPIQPSLLPSYSKNLPLIGLPVSTPVQHPVHESTHGYQPENSAINYLLCQPSCSKYPEVEVNFLLYDLHTDDNTIPDGWKHLLRQEPSQYHLPDHNSVFQYWQHLEQIQHGLRYTSLFGMHNRFHYQPTGNPDPHH